MNTGRLDLITASDKFSWEISRIFGNGVNGVIDVIGLDDCRCRKKQSLTSTLLITCAECCIMPIQLPCTRAFTYTPRINDRQCTSTQQR